ncbi:type I polyketide synthase, partial [Hydrocoleum sp. CS-953]|uniref:acyltransferase domain-containing protein n=1 Tax=Hydrocoleum sp. CS-953 TaxID=1671698 RepID=UPI001FEE72D1
MSAPSGKSQVQLEEGVYRKFGINPETISYVEAHGTATPLGDPIEVEALTEVFSKWTSKKQFCPIGSVKTNIGHPSWAAGIAGLIKTVLCLKNQKLVPSLHFNKANPHIDFENSPFYVNTELRDWEIETDKPRRATVSSFGFSGTNAHIVLEEAPSQVKSRGEWPFALTKVKNGENLERSVNILTLSAKTETSLSELVKSYQSYIKNNPELRIGDICYTANTGRTHFNYRLAVVGSNQEELVEKLQQQQDGEKVAGVYSRAKNAFLFTGQGSQYVNMGRKLYEQSPIFREAIDQCDKILRTLETFQAKSLQEIIYPADDSSDDSILDQTAYTQPCLFAVEYALYKVWESWGIQPDVVMGHSVGEYVAATVAGVLSLEDGLKLIAARGRLMQQLPAGGGMTSVMASESKVLETLKAMSLEEKVAIAAINGPQSIVISGELEAVGEIASKLESSGIKTKQLQVSHAFHSHLMEPMLAEFEAVAKQISYNRPQIKLISNVTGKLEDAEITSAEYWVNHVRQPVRFAESMITLHEKGYELFLEIGPKPILLGMGRRCLPREVGVWLPSLRPGVDEWQLMLSSLGQLYAQGYKVNWLEFHQGYNCEKVVLPTYPFQRERYWVEAQGSYQQKPYWSIANNKNLHPLLGEKINLAGLDNQHRFQSHFTAESPSYLSDHKVFQKVLFPGTGYLEIATSVGKNLFTSQEQVVVSEVHILRGLVLPETEAKTVQIVAIPAEDNKSYKFEIFSSSEGENQQKPEWVLHTKGKIYTEPTTNSPAKIDLEKYQAECNQAIEIKEHYQECSSRGIDYGSTFQGIKQLWKGEGKALGEIILSEELTTQLADYQLHPALLDAALQMILYSITDIEADKTYLPVGIQKFKVYGQTISHVWAIVEMRPNSLTGDIRLVDNEGTLLAEIEGLRITPTTASALLKSLQPDISHWFYQINWQTQPLPADSLSAATGKWLVLAKDTELVTALTNKGQECIRVSPGDKYEQISPQHYQINPTNGEEFKQLLEENPGITKIVHLWSWQSTEIKEVLDLENIQAQNCASVLNLVQATLNSKPETFPQLWLVTQGSQSVISDSEVINPEYASLWG